MDSIKDSISSLAMLFNNRMNEFEKDNQKGLSHSPQSTSSLASQFASFKDFILSALNLLQRQVEVLAKDMDRLEMRNRRKMLLIHGIPEERSENLTSKITTIAAEHLNLTNFASSSIKTCYRLGRPLDKKARPVAIKFTDFPVHDMVWFAKTKLKGTGITLSEFLTKTRHEVFLEARQRFGVVNCWTRDGIIHIIAPDGVRHRVECRSDLEDISSSIPQNSPLPEKTTSTKTADTKRPASRTRRIVKQK